MTESLQTRSTGTAKPDPERLATLCRALGHPARVRILQHLLDMDRCVCGEIVKILPLAQSTVSQHLKSLKEAGLIQGQIEGPSTCYCVDRETLRCFKEAVAAV
jgi:DNA-binding transcriptional ArsR family regulator